MITFTNNKPINVLQFFPGIQENSEGRSTIAPLELLKTLHDGYKWITYYPSKACKAGELIPNKHQEVTSRIQNVIKKPDLPLTVIDWSVQVSEFNPREIAMDLKSFKTVIALAKKTLNLAMSVAKKCEIKVPEKVKHLKLGISFLSSVVNLVMVANKKGHTYRQLGEKLYKLSTELLDIYLCLSGTKLSNGKELALFLADFTLDHLD